MRAFAVLGVSMLVLAGLIVGAAVAEPPRPDRGVVMRGIDGATRVVIFDADGQQEILDGGHRGQHGVWSSDGSKVAFLATAPDEPGEVGAYVAAAEHGYTPVEVFRTDGLEASGEASWTAWSLDLSPDGTRLALAYFHEVDGEIAHQESLVTNTAGEVERRLDLDMAGGQLLRFATDDTLVATDPIPVDAGEDQWHRDIHLVDLRSGDAERAFRTGGEQVVAAHDDRLLLLDDGGQDEWGTGLTEVGLDGEPAGLERISEHATYGQFSPDGSEVWYWDGEQDAGVAQPREGGEAETFLGWPSLPGDSVGEFNGRGVRFQPPPDAVDLTSVSRARGSHRFTTAVRVAAEAFPDGAETVVVARGDDYADALTGGPLAAAEGGPLLLTPHDELRPEVAQEIRRLRADTAILMGGQNALGDAVADDLADLGLEVDRVAGADRWATAAQVADRLDTSTVYLTEGHSEDPDRGWPDAVAVSGRAATEGHPILLTLSDALPPAMEDALADATVEEVVAVGGTEAISEAVVDHAGEAAGADTRRLAGSTRYATSAAVSDGDVPFDSAVLATGHAFPDALAAGPAAAQLGATLLLGDTDTLHHARPVDALLVDSAAELDRALLVGGTSALSDLVADEVEGMRLRR